MPVPAGLGDLADLPDHRSSYTLGLRGTFVSEATTREIRLASPGDAEAVRAIYAPYCTETPITFETEPPSLDEMRSRISRTLEALPWLVCTSGRDLLGYAYAAPFHARAAYRWSVEPTVYLRQDAHRAGIGTALYGTLLELITLLGFYNAYAGITLPNPASVRMQERFGFELVGIYKRVGFKLGAWHDVGRWALRLLSEPSDPSPPRRLEEVLASPEGLAALEGGTRVLARPAGTTST